MEKELARKIQFVNSSIGSNTIYAALYLYSDSKSLFSSIKVFITRSERQSKPIKTIIAEANL
jgi:hypothetical protein